MNELRHSIGPWFLSGGHIVRNRIGEIASIACKARSEEEANANLIAAAPELFEAVSLFIDVLDGFLNQGSLTLVELNRLNDGLPAMRAAIAKADGRTVCDGGHDFGSQD